MEMARKMFQAEGSTIPMGLTPAWSISNSKVSVSPSFNLTVGCSNQLHVDVSNRPSSQLHSVSFAFCPRASGVLRYRMLVGDSNLQQLTFHGGTFDQGGQEVVGICLSLRSSGSLQRPGRLSPCCLFHCFFLLPHFPLPCPLLLLPGITSPK